MRTIRPLEKRDAEPFAQLRRQSLLDAPLAFGASPETDIAPQLIEGVIGAFEDERLAGIVGVYRDRHPKLRHKMQLWGMYVLPDFRCRGIAAELVDAAIHHARSIPEVSWVQLSVTTAAPAARRIYERAGFEVWGTEPEALRHDGESVAEYHMALRL